jgi:hypothetical protein
MVSIGMPLNNTQTVFCEVCTRKTKLAHLMPDGQVKCESCGMEYEQTLIAKARTAKINSGWDDEPETDE